MELMQGVEARHSIREFDSRDVPDESIEAMIRAASFAPSALNEQPWRFYVSRHESRAAIGEVMSQNTHHLDEFLKVLGRNPTDEDLRWYSELGGAPVLVACTLPNETSEFTRMNQQISMGAALQNLLLAATELGLGACSVSFAYWVRDEIAKILGVPEGRSIVSIAVVGYPTHKPPVAPRKSVDIVEYVD